MLRTLAFATTLLLAVPAYGQGFQKGIDEFNSGDYATTLRDWTSAAEAGDADAQTFLGIIYSSGWEVTQDYAEAMRWHLMAAEQGAADAQLNLGFLYGTGRGVAQDYVHARIWFNLAAAQGGGSRCSLGA